MIRATRVALTTLIAACSLPLLSLALLRADDKPDPNITLAEGNIVLKAPKEWVRKAPANRIIEHEFQTPPIEGDKLPGRVTVMGAGGSVEANIDRWIGQFSQPNGKSSKDAAKIEKLKIAGQEVHLVDISGDYNDKPPVAAVPGVLREGYRMLGAIVVTEKHGNYFIKYYGPKNTVAANEKLFKDVLNSLEVK